jgi:hypothetical protein
MNFKINKSGNINQQDIIETPFNGLYEIIFNNPISSQFVSADGKYLIKGDIIDLKTFASLKPSTRVKTLKQNLINAIDDKDKVIFKSKNEKYIIHIFTAHLLLLGKRKQRVLFFLKQLSRLLVKQQLGCYFPSARLMVCKSFLAGI